jgi:hypothetical protein
MRDALNSNPLAQAAVVGVLIVVVAIFVMSSGGGGGEESAGGETTAGVEAAAPEAGAPEAAAPEAATSAVSITSLAAAEAPPLPRPVLAAYKSNQTLVLLFVRDGGIDDRLVKSATAAVAGFPGVAVFQIPAAEVSRYAAITEGVGVERVPALVVVTPKHLEKSVPTASVSYGYQSPESVRQAVIDAGYEGPTLDYHP